MDISFPNFFLALMAVAALWDFWRLELPNALPGLMMLLGLVAVGYDGHLRSVAIQFGIALIVLGAGLVLTDLGFWGGGDAKLLGAAAVWMDWPELAVFVLVIALCGGVLAVALVIARTAVAWSGLKAGSRLWPRALTPREGLPYAVAIAAGAYICRAGIAG